MEDILSALGLENLDTENMNLGMLITVFIAVLRFILNKFTALISGGSEEVSE